MDLPSCLEFGNRLEQVLVDRLPSKLGISLNLHTLRLEYAHGPLPLYLRPAEPSVQLKMHPFALQPLLDFQASAPDEPSSDAGLYLHDPWQYLPPVLRMVHKVLGQ